MKKKLLLIIAFLALSVFISCVAKKEIAQTSNSAAQVEETKPLYKNGDFEYKSVEPWGIFMQGGKATLTVENGELCVDITNLGSVEYAVQLYQDIGTIEYQCKYRVEFDMYSTLPRSVEYRIQMNGGTYEAYSLEHIELTDKKQTFVIDFTMEKSNDIFPRLAFNIGYPVGAPRGEKMPNHKIFLDNLKITLTDATNRIVADETTAKPNIAVNLLGYKPNDEKIAIFRNIELTEVLDTSFKVYTEEGKKAFSGKIEHNSLKDFSTHEINAYADFSSLKKPGRYYIESKYSGKSEIFTIGEEVYNAAFNDVIKMLYLQRCGYELTSEYAGDFAHPICHTSPARIYGTDSFIDVSGGWHDAGDYGRYVVPGVKAAADLLLAYMHYPKAFDDSLGIPESGNGIPDVLDEVRWELEWLLKMQDIKTGGVYHKVTCATFPGFVMPQDETEELIVSPISPTATADFAAILSMASTIYETIDEDFSKTMVEAAEKAWEYLESNPNLPSFYNPKEIETGEYGDTKNTDEKFWAAVELYKATGNTKYNSEIEKIVAKDIPYGLGWADVGYYACISYLTMDESLQNADVYKRIETDILDKAQSLGYYIAKNGYKISMSSSYPWGSNMTVCNNAMILLFASKISNNPEYYEKAMDHFHYIFGRNSLMTSFVTGHGSVAPLNPHHRPTETLNKTMQGMLVGGPNSSLQDPYAKAILEGEPAAKCYVDHEKSYSTNEVTIYWNSPLVYVMAATVK